MKAKSSIAWLMYCRLQVLQAVVTLGEASLEGILGATALLSVVQTDACHKLYAMTA